MSDLTTGSLPPDPLIQVHDVVVIGAGISGLTLALRLQQGSVDVLLTEAADRPGGSISTKSRDGFCWEEGPNSFTPTPALLNLIAEVGLADQLVLADGKLPRYVYWENELIPVPLDPMSALTTPLLSVGGKARVLQCLLGFVGSPPGSEETIEQFFRRQLGSEVVERLVIPFVSGVFAGDTTQLSATAAFGRIADLEANYGSLIAGAVKAPRPPQDPIDPRISPPKRGQLGNFRAGMSQLPKAIGSVLGQSLQLNWRAVSLQPCEQGFLTQFQTPSGLQTIQSRAVVLTVPAYSAALLVESLDPQAQQLLQSIEYPTVAVVALGYPSKALPQSLQGFGHLIPRSAGLRTLGTIWSSCLFPNRAPAGYHCFLNFIGGATDPGYATRRGLPGLTQLSSAQRAEIVHGELSRILLTQPVQPEVLGERLWSKAIPQYTLGHRQRIAQIQQRLQRIRGLSLCANYQDGVALGDCIKRAEAEAGRVLAFLNGSED